jgi:hypothetical protein
MRSPARRVAVLLPLLVAAALLLVPGPAGRADDDGPAGSGGGKDPMSDAADGPVPFADQVNKAIDQGVAWLLARPDFFNTNHFDMAHWGLIHGDHLYGGGTGLQYQHPAGCTALALYTLLKCGVDPDNPVIVRGFNWLREPHGITEQYDGAHGNAIGWDWDSRLARSSYELSAEILALAARYDPHKRTKNTKTLRRRGKLHIRDKADREWLQDMATELVRRRGIPAEDPPPEDRQGWRYNVNPVTLKRGRSTLNVPSSNLPPNANQDLSSTQLATLALYNAHQFGADVDLSVWFDIVDFTLAHQEKDGPEHERYDPAYHSGGYAAPIDHARGFMYIPGSPDNSEGKATGSMTGCGVVNLLLAKDVILEDRKGQHEWQERHLDSVVDKAVWDGLAWLDLHWSPFMNPSSQYGYHIYYLYAMERAMDVLGKNLIGKHLWYVECGKQILAHQEAAKVKKDPTGGGSEEVDGVFWNTKSTHDPKDVLDTCFALLFLKRATQDLVPGGVPVTGGDEAPRDGR